MKEIEFLKKYPFRKKIAEAFFKKDNAGFTLVEILISLVILLILSAALWAILDPFEQINKANDGLTRAAAVQFEQGALRYVNSYRQYPWQKDSSCVVLPTTTPTPTPTNTPTPTPTNTPTPTATPTNTPPPTPTPTPVPAWLTTTNLPQPLFYHSAVANNGYGYLIGGYNNGYLSTVYYSQINANGTLGAWALTTALPVATGQHASVVYNGYVYVIAGNATAAVYFAPINANGTLGSWTATTSLPQIIRMHAAVVNNGYMYVLGGINASSQYLSTVYYAPINANGTLGAWVSTTAMPNAVLGLTADVNNGYMYIAGGNTSASTIPNVYFAPINANGTLGAWVSTTSLPQARDIHSSAVNNNFLYILGGGSTSLSPYIFATVYKAAINANGTLGAWSASTNLPQTIFYHKSFVYNGYVYVLGGENGAALSTVYYYSPANTLGASTYEPPSNLIAQVLPTPTPPTYSVLPSSLTLAGLMPCIDQMVQAGEIKSNFDTISQSTLNNIYVFSPDPNNSSDPKSILTCFKPVSKSARNDPLYKFDANGNPVCDPASKACYICISQ